MSQQQHTPGPWKTKGMPCGIDIVAYAPDQEHHHVTIAVVLGGNTQEEERSNAYFVAAAPDLLEACKSALLNVCAAHGFPSKVSQQIMKAIVKAEGRA